MEFWELYDQYYVRVRKFILSLVRDEWVADDLIQETFLRIQNNLKSLKDPSKLSSWIFRIAYNLCQDHFRQSKRSRKEERIDQEETEDFKEALMQRGPDIQKELEQRQMGECVQNYIHLLPEPLRVVLILFDTMDFNQQEIADTLGVTIENVKVRLHRARKKLKDILEEACTFERDERNVLVCTPASDGQTRISGKQPDSRLSAKGTSSSKEKAKGRKQSKR
jgi:RNA polymerase sigma-70 factor (ECF subfamily)